tara:strand:+ start:2389 stop:2841 length:453 start_codon:yes stop_codon:yes gene_type:complete
MTDERLKQFHSVDELKNLRGKIYKKCKKISSNINATNIILKKGDRLLLLVLFLNIFSNVINYVSNLKLDIYILFVMISNFIGYGFLYFHRYKRSTWVRSQLLYNLDEIAIQITLEIEKDNMKKRNPNLDKMILFYISRYESEFKEHKKKE